MNANDTINPNGPYVRMVMQLDAPVKDGGVLYPEAPPAPPPPPPVRNTDFTDYRLFDGEGFAGSAVLIPVSSTSFQSVPERSPHALALCPSPAGRSVPGRLHARRNDGRDDTGRSDDADVRPDLHRSCQQSGRPAAIARNDAKSRLADMLLRGDLRRGSYRAETGSQNGIYPLVRYETPSIYQRGYFYLSENSEANPLDDVLQFTTFVSRYSRNRDPSPYYGRAALVTLGGAPVLGYLPNPVVTVQAVLQQPPGH